MASRIPVAVPPGFETPPQKARLVLAAQQPRRVRASAWPNLAYAITAGFALRLVTIAFLYADRLDPWRGHWRFAWEMGMISRSLATGHGMSSPFPPNTGPTAWQTPVYPTLMAAVFKVFGLFTARSAIALLSLNAMFSVLTCVPLYFLARRTVGEREARWAVWIWALFPYAVYVTATRIWENCLTTLLLTTLIWFTLALEQRSTRLRWAGYGLLWGVTALCNPSTCALLPFLGLWVAVRRHRRALPWVSHAIVGALLFAAVLTPWELRNARTFHHFVPLRDNFWMEVRVGNTGDLSDIYQDWAHPGRDARELSDYQRLGEYAYMAHMRDVSLHFIAGHPVFFAWLTAKRIIYTWSGFWSTNPAYVKNEPFQPSNTLFCSTLSVLAFLGLRRMWRSRKEWMAPFVIALGIFPLIYYVTHPGIDYRHPIDPMIVILVATGIASLRKNRKAAHS